jgi:hypothetical protein
MREPLEPGLNVTIERFPHQKKHREGFAPMKQCKLTKAKGKTTKQVAHGLVQ